MNRSNSTVRFLLSITVLLYSILLTQSVSAGPKEKESGEILIPKFCHTSVQELIQLKKKSESGDCDASTKLHDYYAFCTKHVYLALHYGILAYDQGCEKAKKSVQETEHALGISESAIKQR